MANDILFKTTMDFAYGQAADMAVDVSRLVAPNPGPYTFKGTNTYIVGSNELAVVDPGPEDEDHLRAILKTVGPRKVSHILITHRHRDHTGLARRLQEKTGAEIHAYGPVEFLRTPDGDNGENVDASLAANQLFEDTEVVAGNGWTMDVIHTPGHLCDHVSFRLRERNLLFSGDHVMAWNTSVIAPPDGRMADYLSSLQKLNGIDVDVFLPGHGGRVEQPRRTVKAFLLHRQWREQAILDALNGECQTINAVVGVVYDGLDERLVRAASLSVQAHVEHLKERGRVSYSEPLAFDTPIGVV